MRFVNRFLSAISILALSTICLAAQASVQAPEAGKEYSALKRAQPTESGKKIEVIEFFAYYCPHCNALEPLLEAWVKKNSDKIVFKRIHVLNPGIETQQKLFFTLDAMGIADQYQRKAFEAYHVLHNRLLTDAQIGDFVKQVGIDKTKFFGVYNSFTVQTKISRAQQLTRDYEINSWPTLIIDGRLMTSPSMAVSNIGRVSEEEQNQAMFPVLDWLISKAQKEKSAK